MIEKLNNRITLLTGEVKLLQTDKEIDEHFDKNRKSMMNFLLKPRAAYRIMHMTCLGNDKVSEKVSNRVKSYFKCVKLSHYNHN